MKSSTIAEKLNLQQLMTSLKSLHEEIDQSKEEPFNPHFADSLHYSNASIAGGSEMGELGDLGDGQRMLNDICRKETHSQWGHGFEPVGIVELAELREVNRRLF